MLLTERKNYQNDLNIVNNNFKKFICINRHQLNTMIKLLYNHIQDFMETYLCKSPLFDSSGHDQYFIQDCHYMNYEAKPIKQLNSLKWNHSILKIKQLIVANTPGNQGYFLNARKYEYILNICLGSQVPNYSEDSQSHLYVSLESDLQRYKVVEQKCIKRS